MKRKILYSYRHTLLLSGILLSGFALRVLLPTLVEYKLDEANVVRLAQAIAYEGYLPATGVNSSTNIANLPFMLYLIALPLRLWNDPLAAVLFVGCLNGLAVAGVYWLGRRYFHPNAGLIAALLFAVSAWAVIYSRKVWCRTLPLFTLIFIAALLLTFVERKPWALVAAFASLAALVGLQLEGIAFIPILGLALALYWKDIALKPLIVGCSVLGLALTPYIIHDAAHGWPNARGFLNFAAKSSGFSLAALRYPLELAGSAGIERLIGAGPQAAFRAGLPVLTWIDTVMMIFVMASLLYAVIRVIRLRVRRQAAPARALEIILIWLLIPIGLQLRSTQVQPHYFVLLYPAQFLIIGIAGAALLQRVTHRAFRVSAAALLLIWGGWQIANIAQLWTVMTSHPTTGGYGIPLRYPRAAAQAAQACAGEIRVLSNGAAPTVDEQATVFDTLLLRRARAFAQGGIALPLPHAADSIYVIGPIPAGDGAFAPLLTQLEQLHGLQTTTNIALADGWRYEVLCRHAAGREEALADFTRLPSDAPFANSVIVTGFRAPTAAFPGDIIPVDLAWWLRDTAHTDQLTQFYIHLLNAEGDTVAQVDHDGGYPVQSWRPGELVLSRFTLSLPDSLPDGAYTLRAGLYTLPGIEYIPLVSPAGKPIGDSITLGILDIHTRPHP